MNTLNDSQSRYAFGQTNWSRVLEAGQAEGDSGQRARNELLVRYHDAVYRFLIAKLGDSDAACELFSRFAERVVDLHPFLQRADPEKGRFRTYLRTVLSRMVIDFHRENQREQKKRRPLMEDAVAEPADDTDRGREDDQFRTVWVDELMKHAWEGLERVERLKGQPYHSLLLYKARNPEARSEAMALHFAKELAKPMSAPNIRQLLHRGHEMLNDLLIEEIVRSLRKSPGEPVTAEAIEAELIELRLLDKHRRDALDRYREQIA